MFHNVVKENVYITQLDEFINHKAERRADYGEDFLPRPGSKLIGYTYRSSFSRST
jgi:hypothetical protein